VATHAQEQKYGGQKIAQQALFLKKKKFKNEAMESLPNLMNKFHATQGSFENF
jgi:hypothetical protein